MTTPSPDDGQLAIRRWLLAAAFIGAGQQLFVALRNLHLRALGVDLRTIAQVQAAGGAAGLLAGMIGLWALPRRPARDLLVGGVTMNAVGFAIQAGSDSPGAFVGGAAVAGFGIQFVTMAAAPFLADAAGRSDAVRVFGLQALWIQSVPAALGALLGGIVYREASELPGGAPHNGALALLLGGVLVGCGALLATRVPVRPAAHPLGGPLLRLDRPRAVVALLAPDVLVTAAVGLSAPFLPLYLQHRGFAPDVVARTAAVALLLAGLLQLLAPGLVRRAGSRAPLATAHLALGGAVLAMGLDFAVGLCLAALAVFRQAVTSASAPVYSALLHTRTNAADSAAVAAWRMLAQSLVWPLANVAAGALMAAPHGFTWWLAACAGLHLSAAIAMRVCLPRG